MNIIEATKKAVEQNGYMTPGDEFKNVIFIKPTDTCDNCIITGIESPPRRGWQPHAKDLLSNDWEFVTKEEFLSLSKQYIPF